MPNHITRGFPNYYMEANWYSTEAAYRDNHSEVDQECTEAIIRKTFTKKWSTETLLNSPWRDGKIIIWNVESGVPSAEVCSYHGEYDHLL